MAMPLNYQKLRCKYLRLYIILDVMNNLFLKICGQYLFCAVMITVLYYLSGRAGLLLTVPPSQSAVIWPPAGIALAVLMLKGIKYAPAIFFGAIGTSLYHYDVIDVQALATAASIGFGAALQAVVGCLLVRQFVRLPSAIEELKDALAIIILGGVIACLVNALWGNFVLYAAGFASLESLPVNIFTWWAGDVFGVLIFTPIFLLLFTAKGGDVSVSRMRRITISTILIIVLAAVMYVFVVTEQYEYRKRLEVFNKDAVDVAGILQREMNSSVDVLRANERFISASEYISAEEFKLFTERFLRDGRGIYGLSWIPKVDGASRDVFEQTIRLQGYDDFNIMRRVSIGELGVAEPRDIYFPISYVEPYDKNARAHGLDVYGLDPVVGAARITLLDQARDTGEVVATPIFSIVQAEQQNGFILYFPVYSQDVRAVSLAQRRASLIGYCNGIFTLPQMMAATRRSADEHGMDVVLFDVTQGEGAAQVLYDSRSPDFKESQTPPTVYDYQLRTSREYQVAGRRWRLDFIQKPTAHENAGWLIWLVLSGGLACAGFVSLFMFMVTARTDIVERLVEKKTKETEDARAFLELIMRNNPDFVFVKDENLRIVEANAAFINAYPEDQRDSVIGSGSDEGYSVEDYAEFTALDRKAFREGSSETIENITFPDGTIRSLHTQKICFENADGQKFILGLSRDVTEREKLIEELSETNAELEEFAYRTSHDLRSPLISSTKLLSMAGDALAKSNAEQAEKCVGMALTSLQKLEVLIDDILVLTETKNAQEAELEVNISALVDDAVEKLQYMDGFEQVSLEKDIAYNDLIKVKRGRLALIIENMLSNAVKYRDPEQGGAYVRISANVQRGALVIAVEDNGLGVPKENQADLFGMFKRFHPKVSYGSGLGLYMMKKSAGILGGDLVFEQPEKGSIFKLTLPLR
jgi:PAS domain S-box-containing protein